MTAAIGMMMDMRKRALTHGSFKKAIIKLKINLINLIFN